MHSSEEPRILVEIKNFPAKSAGTAHEISRFIRDILEKLHYHGKWEIFFSKEISKQQDFKFQFVQRRGAYLFCQVNSKNLTCWEVRLCPPKGYLLDIIANDLKQIHPNGEVLSNLILKAPHIQPAVGRKVLAIKGGSDKPPVAMVPQPQDIIPIPKTAKKIQTLNVKTKNLCRDGGSLSFALQCIGKHVSSPDGFIDTPTAIQALQEAVAETQFLKKNPHYSDSLKVCVILLKGLCDRGFVTRMTPKVNKSSRYRVRTKGYLLTPNGRKKLSEEWDNGVPQQQSEELSIIPKSQKSIISQATNSSDIGLLFETFSAKKQAIEECNTLIQEQQTLQDTLVQEMQDLPVKIQELRQQLIQMELNLGSKSEREQKILQEIKLLELMKADEVAALEEIKSKIKNAIGD